MVAVRLHVAGLHRGRHSVSTQNSTRTAGLYLIFRSVVVRQEEQREYEWEKNCNYNLFFVTSGLEAVFETCSSCGYTDSLTFCTTRQDNLAKLPFSGCVKGVCVCVCVAVLVCGRQVGRVGELLLLLAEDLELQELLLLLQQAGVSRVHRCFIDLPLLVRRNVLMILQLFHSWLCLFGLCAAAFIAGCLG